MVRMVDLRESARASLEALDCPTLASKPWIQGPPLAKRRVAIISSAGLMLRGEKTVGRGASEYRAIPHAAPAGDILMSHVSVNFDRTGFQQDLNVILPRDRLDELVAAGEIGSAATTHYAFMGATDPRAMETPARAVAARLKAERTDSAVLLPV